MAVAGRVSIVPKGDYVEGNTYKRLDLVLYDGKGYVAKLDNVNVTPVDGDTWMYVWSDAGDVGSLEQKVLDLENLLTPQGTALNKNFETEATNILMNGVASIGSSANIPRADHVHPSDTTKLSVDGNSKNNIVSFSSGDTDTPTTIKEVALLQSDEKHSSLFAKISNVVSNVRWLINNSFDKSNILDTIEEVSAVTESGNVADALVIKELNNNLNKAIMFKTVNNTCNVPASGSGTCRINIAVDGYTPIGVLSLAQNYTSNIQLQIFTVSDTEVYSEWSNKGTSAYNSVPITARIAYIKSDYIV